eukprot:6483767-Amphidinium_carterae.1
MAQGERRLAAFCLMRAVTHGSDVTAFEVPLGSLSSPAGLCEIAHNAASFQPEVFTTEESHRI